MRTCLLCEQLLSDELTWRQIFSLEPLTEELLCPDCRGAFKYFHAEEFCCASCHRPLVKPSTNQQSLAWWQVAHRRGSDWLCQDCLHWSRTCPEQYLTHEAILHYTSHVREWFYQYKYRGDCRLASIARPYLRQVHRHYRDYDWLVLPSSPSSWQKRHFHPTSELLRQAKIPFACPFDYIGSDQRQAQKTREERLKLQDVFRLKYDYKIPKKCLIFDDVYTTGATIQQAKKCLYEHHDRPLALEIKSLTLALDILSTIKI